MEPSEFDPDQSWIILKTTDFYDDYASKIGYGVVIQNLSQLTDDKFERIRHLSVGDDAWYRNGQWYPCDAL